MQPELNLYAEFLLNIRQVTIYANLEDAQRSSKNVLISSDKKSLTVSYDGVDARITFPSGISGTATVEFPVEKRKSISLRLEITEDDKPPHTIGMDVDNDAPWPAGSLSTESRIACRSCKQVLVNQADRKWRDLPREHWAELMDLWHCHKPAAPLPNDSQVSNKGYSAASRPKVREGLVFVDTCHFLVTEQETEHIKITDSIVTCDVCDAQVGTLDGGFEGLRFDKWSIIVQRHQTASWEQNDLQNFVCAQLLALIESQATKKFVVHSGTVSSENSSLLLWVFNPDLKYSASDRNDGRPRRAMKVLFKDVQDIAAALESNPAAEEIELPSGVLRQLRSDLQTSNKILPSRAKELQDWRVGLLDRFDALEDLQTQEKD